MNNCSFKEQSEPGERRGGEMGTKREGSCSHHVEKSVNVRRGEDINTGFGPSVVVEAISMTTSGLLGGRACPPMCAAVI